MSSIKALIFLNILLLITSHACGNRLYKIKAETFASNHLENSEDAKDINGLYFTSKRKSSLGGHIGNLLPTRNRLRQSFFKSRINRYSSLSICSNVQLLKDSSVRLILIAGDIHQHPGPLKFPCSVCNKSVTSRQKAVECDTCQRWCHRGCGRISLVEYRNMMKLSNFEWSCPICIHFEHTQIEDRQHQTRDQNLVEVGPKGGPALHIWRVIADKINSIDL